MGSSQNSVAVCETTYTSKTAPMLLRTVESSGPDLIQTRDGLRSKTTTQETNSSTPNALHQARNVCFFKEYSICMALLSDRCPSFLISYPSSKPPLPYLSQVEQTILGHLRTQSIHDSMPISLCPEQCRSPIDTIP